MFQNGVPYTSSSKLWNQRRPSYFGRMLNIIWMILLAIILEIFSRAPNLRIEMLAKRTGQVAIVTGGPRSLAIGLLKRLIQLDYTVIMGVRNLADCQRRLDEFAKNNPNLSVKNVTFYELDLESLKSVKKFAGQILQNVDRLDLLLCNAGIAPDCFKTTKDGLEACFQVNYLSQFLLTQLLTDILKKTASSKNSPCHVVNTSSIMSEAGEYYFDYPGVPAPLTGPKLYASSKLCQVASTFLLEKKSIEDGDRIHYFAVHPGAIASTLWQDGYGYLGKLTLVFLSPFCRDIDGGADTVLLPVLSPESENIGGLYLVNGKQRQATKEALDMKNQTRLFEKSLEIISEKLK